MNAVHRKYGSALLAVVCVAILGLLGPPAQGAQHAELSVGYGLGFNHTTGYRGVAVTYRTKDYLVTALGTLDQPNGSTGTVVVPSNDYSVPAIQSFRDSRTAPHTGVGAAWTFFNPGWVRASVGGMYFDTKSDVVAKELGWLVDVDVPIGRYFSGSVRHSSVYGISGDGFDTAWLNYRHRF